MYRPSVRALARMRLCRFRHSVHKYAWMQSTARTTFTFPFSAISSATTTTFEHLCVFVSYASNTERLVPISIFLIFFTINVSLPLESIRFKARNETRLLFLQRLECLSHFKSNLKNIVRGSGVGSANIASKNEDSAISAFFELSHPIEMIFCECGPRCPKITSYAIGNKLNVESVFYPINLRMTNTPYTARQDFVFYSTICKQIQPRAVVDLLKCFLFSFH